jgi:DNA-nicking Smr family endonuclease
MVWKQDLAKLKKELQDEGAGEPPTPAPPKKAEKPRESRPIEEEDALFLQTMGKRPAPPPLPSPPLTEQPKDLLIHTLAKDTDSFEKAMTELKLIKPAEAPGVPPPLPAPAQPQTPVQPLRSRREDTALKAPLLSQLLAASEETRPLDAPPPPPASLKPKGPVLIQLAAGMAIEVDGLLDLRNHTLSDARERLKERLEDSILLGWRSIHVILGPSEALKQGFLAFLTTPAARTVQRYAQAPVPMGGSQAWILYLGTGQP